MSKFKPLLAAAADLNKLDYTNLWASPKLDGIRAIVIDSVVMSRTLKPIPNLRVQWTFGREEFNGFDGELIVGEPCAKDVYNQTYSGVMKKEGEPHVRFYVFDDVIMPNLEYQSRLGRVPYNMVVQQDPIQDYQQLLDYETMLLTLGYEGVMLRKFHGPQSFYKYGRSTANEGTLLKLKRFCDAEAIIVGVEEEMANNNEATTDNLGRTARSSHQENKVGKGRLGALICETPEGVRFNIGTGFDAAQRARLWEFRHTLPGQHAKYKCFPIGVVNAPRFPVFLGLRSPIDM